MTITTHAAIGAAIGFNVGSPILGFILGVASHFLVDMIPHGDSALLKQLRAGKKIRGPIAYGTVDSLIALMLILVLSNIDVYTSTLAFTAAIAGSILPDLLSGFYDLTKSKYLLWFNKLHFFFHDYFLKRYKDVKLSYSLVVQTVFIITLIQYTT